MDTALHWLQPYEFSPLIAAVFALVVLCYARGLRECRRRGGRPGLLRPLAFLLGVGLCYGVMHTRFDYLAQYLFFMHRIQHLALHHLGPFLIALAVPWEVLTLGLPAALRWRLRTLVSSRPVRGTYAVLQHPVVAPLLFVGLIYFWLAPSIHFDAMLSADLYQLMNWSMLIDGLLFWWLMLDPRDPMQANSPRHMTRLLILFLIMVPQILLGAWITLSGAELYDVYSVCGRAWPIAPATDQRLGGLVTWIPAAMMSVLGILVVLTFILRRERGRMNPETGDRGEPCATGV